MQLNLDFWYSWLCFTFICLFRWLGLNHKLILNHFLVGEQWIKSLLIIIIHGPNSGSRVPHSCSEALSKSPLIRSQLTLGIRGREKSSRVKSIKNKIELNWIYKILQHNTILAWSYNSIIEKLLSVAGYHLQESSSFNGATY